MNPRDSFPLDDGQDVEPSGVVEAFAQNITPMLKQKQIVVDYTPATGGAGVGTAARTAPAQARVIGLNPAGWFDCEPATGGGDGGAGIGLRLPANHHFVAIVFQKLGLYATSAAGAGGSGQK